MASNPVWIYSSLWYLYLLYYVPIIMILFKILDKKVLSSSKNPLKGPIMCFAHILYIVGIFVESMKFLSSLYHYVCIRSPSQNLKFK